VSDAEDPPPTVLEVIEGDNWLWEPGEIKVVPLGRPATIADLRRTKLKAEIVNGELLVIGPSGGRAATAAGNIVFSLHLYERGVRRPRYDDVTRGVHRRSAAPPVDLSGRELVHGTSVAVRDGIDHGDEAERRMAAKRADYFSAGTQVVWDVDVLTENLIRVYSADDPDHATVYRQGEIAEAEPAVPGWRFAVDELLD
jgi:Uma2 family endonuclease